MNIFTRIFQHNWPAIIYFNFKMLPLKQAIHLPFDFYHKVRFNDLSGKIVLKHKPYRGMIKIGGRGSDIFPCQCSVITLQGKWELGAGIELGTGISIVIKESGNLIFGNNIRLGAYTKIYCEELITMASQIGVSWESQIFDTNFHFIQNVETKETYPIHAPIKIGSFCWFGNRVNIMKGTVVPDYTIVASNSLCNKDYSDIPHYSIMAGTPVKLKKSGYKRLFEGVDL